MSMKKGQKQIPRVTPSKAVKQMPPTPRDPSSHTFSGNGGSDGSIQMRPGSMADPPAPTKRETSISRSAVAMPALKTTPTC